MMSIEDIIKEILKYQTKYVCITGGEPLLQGEIYTLMQKLCDLNLKVSLETSGSKDCGRVDPRVKKIIDVKTPDSAEGKSFDLNNLKFADADTEFKFVICSEDDFYWSESFAKDNHLFEKTNVLYSPAFEKIDEKWLAKKILSEKSSARLQLQLHKYIWSANTRGV